MQIKKVFEWIQWSSNRCRPQLTLRKPSFSRMWKTVPPQLQPASLLTTTSLSEPTRSSRRSAQPVFFTLFAKKLKMGRHAPVYKSPFWILCSRTTSFLWLRPTRGSRWSCWCTTRRATSAGRWWWLPMERGEGRAGRSFTFTDTVQIKVMWCWCDCLIFAVSVI